MKKLIILFLLAVPCFAQTFTVSGHLFDPTNASSSTGTITFTLVNTGDQVCRVSGTGVIVPTVKTFTVNASTGVFSGTLYRNDFIVCGTSLNTQWQYVAQIPGSAQPACVLPQVASSSLNVDSTACSNTVPVVAAGVGDTTYCRLDGTNCGFTGPITGTSAAFTGNVSVVGTLGASKINGAPAVDGVTFTTVAAALASLSGAGGRVDVPPGTYSFSSTISLASGQRIVCADPFNTVLSYTGTGDAIALDSVSHAGIENCGLKLGSSTTGVGIHFKNTTADNKWNELRNLEIFSASNVVGQKGLIQESTTSFAMYWNSVIALDVVNVDQPIVLTGNCTGGNGANDNTFVHLTLHSYSSGVQLLNCATEDKFFGLSGSASGFVGANTLVTIGDGSTAVRYHHIEGMVCDAGASGKSYAITASATNNYIEYNDGCGSGPTDVGSQTTAVRIGGAVPYIASPQVVAGTTVVVPESGASLFNSSDATHWLRLNSNNAIPWRQGVFGNNNLWWGLGVYNATGGNSAQAKTANTGGVNHLWHILTFAGVEDYCFASHATDDTVLTCTSYWHSDPVSNIITSNAKIVSTGNTVRLIADFPLAANTSLQAIFSWSLPAVALNYNFHCNLNYSQATAAVSDAFGIQAAANAPTNLVTSGIVYTAASTSTSGTSGNVSTTTATNVLTFTPSATGTVFTASLDGQLENPASLNTLNVMASQSNSSDLLTIKRGSYCQMF